MSIVELSAVPVVLDEPVSTVLVAVTLSPLLVVVDVVAAEELLDTMVPPATAAASPVIVLEAK